MVAASQRTRSLRNHDHLPVAQSSNLGSAGGHGAQGSDAQRGETQLDTDTLSMVWLRGGFGRGAGASSAGFLYHMDWLKYVYTKVGPSGVPPPVHERSHGNAHARLSVIAWQVGVWLQRLSHESILSMNSL